MANDASIEAWDKESLSEHHCIAFVNSVGSWHAFELIGGGSPAYKVATTTQLLSTE